MRLHALSQRVGLQIFKRDKLERGRVSCFEINRRGAAMFERGFPARDADAPFVARF